MMLPRDEALNAIQEDGVLAIIRLDSSAQLLKAAEAIREGGIRAIEFTMTTPGALETLAEASRSMDRTTVLGAGTVLDAETARAAILAGAKFLVAPGLRTEVITLARRYNVAVFPGAFTPTEILTAWEAGADVVKVFPASVGGPELIKALRGPFPYIKMLPTGGVNLTTVTAFIRAGAVAVAVGGNLVSKDAIQRGEFTQITALAKQYVDLVAQARKAG